MRFEINLKLTENDYLAFNFFHSLESLPGKRQVNKSRFIFTAIMIVFTVLILILSNFSPFSIIYVIVLGIFAALYAVFIKKMLKQTLKAQIKRLMKTGKPPFDPESKIEFYEDKLVEITPTKRIEQSYAGLERICVKADQYMFLYTSSVGAYILPIPQIEEQSGYQNLLSFLLSKCSTVEYY